MSDTDNLKEENNEEKEGVIDLDDTNTSDNSDASDDAEFIETDEEGNPTNLTGPGALKKLREKLSKAVEEKQQYLDGWQRDKAEFINARKRDDEQKNEFLKFAEQKVIEDLLPTLDAFEMAIGNKAQWESVSKEWRGGIEGIYNSLLNTLSKYGVESFTQIGDVFDPNFHHSIAVTTTNDKTKEHTISDVLQRGYKIKDKVLRPALVKVFEYTE